MATFIALITETQEGEVNIQDSVSRAAQFVDKAKQFGVTIESQYWTMGAYDGVLIFDAPDDETAASLMLHLASKGSVRTHTLRAFDAEGMMRDADVVEGEALAPVLQGMFSRYYHAKTSIRQNLGGRSH